MNLEAIWEVRYIDFGEGIDTQFMVINQLLKEGWRVFMMNTETHFNRSRRFDNQLDYCVLVRLEEEPVGTLIYDQIRDVHVESDVERMSALVQAGWRLLDINRTNLGKATSYVLGRPFGVQDFILGECETPTKVEYLIEGLHIFRQYDLHPILQATKRSKYILHILVGEYAQLMDEDHELLRKMGWTQLQNGVWALSV